MDTRANFDFIKSIGGFSAFLLANAIAVHSASAADFPGTGHKFIADFKKFRFEQTYTSPTSLTYTALNPDGSRGASDTVSVQTQELTNSVYMVSWQESNKATVVQIQDYGRKIIYTNLTMPDGTFVRIEGTFVPTE